jgi:uncharacterized repeat protein (TIGR01451 family)
MCLPTVGTAQILSNLPGTSSGTGTDLGLGIDAADRTKAVGLTMGADPMVFDSLEALLSNPTPASTLSGGIFSDVGGNPGVELVAFDPVPVAESTPPTVFTVTAAAPFTLEANTAYWFVLDGPATTNSLQWDSLDPNVAPTPAPGITFDGYLFSSDGGTSWGASAVFNGVAINASLGPTDADLSIDKTGGFANDQILFTVTVTNSGPDDATNVVVTDPLPPEVTYDSDDCGGMDVPPWTWNVGSLPVNTSATCNLTVDVDPDATGEVVNTATVTADQNDPSPGDESSTAVVPLGGGSVLEIPTLGRMGLLLLVLVLAGVGALMITKRS